MSLPFYHDYSQYLTVKEESCPVEGYIGEFVFPNSKRARFYINSKGNPEPLYLMFVTDNTIQNEPYLYGIGKGFFKMGDEKRILEILEELKNMPDTEAINKEITQDM